MSKPSRATLFGVPISWIIICAAILAATSIVPLVIFPAGGYAPLSMALMPVVGIILGPFGGLIAGLVGGVLGFFISPGAFILVPVNLIAPWALIPFNAGALVNKDFKWRHLLPPFWLLLMAISWIVPYYYPGPPRFANPPALDAWISMDWFALIVFPLYLVFGWKLIPDWFERSESKIKLAVGAWTLSFMAIESMHPFEWLTQLVAANPATYRMSISNLYIPPTRQPVFLISAALIVAIFLALRRAKLRSFAGIVWGKLASKET